MKKIFKVLALPFYFMCIVLWFPVLWVQTILLKVEKWLERFIF